MKTHLADEQIAAVVAGLELDDEVRRHLDTCLGCRAAVSEMRTLLDTRRREIEAGGPDWEAQRERVLAGLEEGGAPPARRRWWRTPAVAAAAVVVMAVGLGLLQMPGNTDRTAEEIVVEEVLAEAELLLADESIPGFELIDPGIDDLEAFAEGDVSNGGAS
jgi:anti-sigma factor RsiW